MSFNPSHHTNTPLDAIDTVIIPRARDIEGFEVRRALPSTKRKMVGPFIFFDQMGPAEFITQGGIDVRPHPHIGLGTVTYLFQGEFEHRDSLGTRQMIYPGEVNWMLAGRGVTHSERTSAQTRQSAHQLFGIQTWLALPESKEDLAPGFEHHKAASLPLIQDKDVNARLILGRAWGQKAPAEMLSDLFYADVSLGPNGAFPLPDDHEDRAIYVLEGSVIIAGDRFETGAMLVFRPGDPICITASDQGARLMALGGETLSEERYIWWNFVSSDIDKIEAAKTAWIKADWENGPFTLPPGDQDEYVEITKELQRMRIKK